MSSADLSSSLPAAWRRLLEQAEALEKKLAAEPASPKSAEWGKEYTRLQPIVHAVQAYGECLRQIRQAQELLNETDPEIQQMAREEKQRLQERLESLKRQVQQSLLPPVPNADRSAILEIRAGTGGEEAALFAADLVRMYARFAQRHNLRMEMLSAHPTERGGFKEVVFAVNGMGAYNWFRFEGGVHRVQRVPETEARGRVHTSAASVVVLPEAEETEIQLSEKDLRVDTFCASGPGGQGVNTTYSAVRVTHLPTGIVVQCQDERSQIQNKAKALRVLAARLKDKAEQEAREKEGALRRKMVQSGDRSEKIRTYNFPQNRLTDHRIGLTVYRLDQILEGDLDEVWQALYAADEAERLKEIEEAGA